MSQTLERGMNELAPADPHPVTSDVLQFPSNAFQKFESVSKSCKKYPRFGTYQGVTGE